MASVDFKKYKNTSTLKAVFRHCDKEERQHHDHKNEQIDKAATVRNLQIGGDYKTICKRYDERIKTLDSTTNTNKRKDRVLAFGLSITTPEGLKEEDYNKFFQKVGGEIQKQYGKQNTIGAYIHYDEIHEYIDNGQVKTSHPHMHMYIVPEKEGVLNGKWFSSKANMIKLNKNINLMCLKEFGIPFMTGEKARKRSTEELKRLSNKEIAEREKHVLQLEKQIKNKQNELNELEKQIIDRSVIPNALNEIKLLENSMNKAKEDLQALATNKLNKGDFLLAGKLESVAALLDKTQILKKSLNKAYKKQIELDYER